MLSLTSVSSRQAASYYGRDDYYTEGKETGIWQGRGAAALGLEGSIHKEDFQNVLHGRDREGNDLVTSQNGKEHRAGVDLTFSDPKSVSILSEVAGDLRIREAHQLAVSRTLAFVEKNFSEARITKDGLTERVQTGNMVFGTFFHNVSRAQDPNTHSHAVAMNMLQRPDGEWRAMVNDKLYENKMLIGQIFRNELAANLIKFGYEVEVGRQGLFEIKGVPHELLLEFSQRRQEILRVLDGREGSALAEKITLITRETKAHGVDRNELRKDWLSRSAEHGYTPEMIRENALQAARGVEKESLGSHSLSNTIQSLEIQTAVWSKEEMMKSALKNGLSEGLTIDQVEKQIQKALESRELIQLDTNKYSSLEAIKTEQRIIELVQNHQGTFLTNNRDQIQSVIQEYGPHLNEGQRAAVLHITGTPDGVAGVQGYAGVGKTTMLSVANQYWEKEGYHVTGLAYTGRAAELLQMEAGIKSQTLHSFLGEKEGSPGVQPSGRQVWVVDESSMVGNNLMLPLLNAAEKEKAKVVLLGDKYQLQAVDAGKMFQVLQEKGIMATARMDNILRQKTELLKEAVHAITKEMDPEKAVHLLDAGGVVREINSREERLLAIAKDYLALTPKEMKNTLIVTARNADRLEINQLIREGLKETGQLNESSERTYTVAIPKAIQEEDRKLGASYDKGDMVRFLRANQGLDVGRGDRGMVQGIDGNEMKVQLENSNRTISVDLEKYHKLEAYSMEARQFAPGDQVMFLRNDKTLGVVNGSVGMVVDVKDNFLKVETRTGTKEVDLKTYNHIDHSYGSTLHKSQGMTSERVMIHIDTNQGVSNSANSFYVGLSRASYQATVYSNSKERLPESVSQWQGKESTQDYEKGKAMSFENGKGDHKDFHHENNKTIHLGNGFER